MESPLVLGLMLATGVFWTAAYVLIIRRSHLDAAVGMPMPALCLNLAWELAFTVVQPHHVPQVVINGVWLLFDLGILALFVRHGRREFDERLAPLPFLPTLGAGLLLALAGVLAATHDFHDPDGRYAAFGMNLLMSMLFVAMVLRRRSVRGQSMWIAATKLLGSLCSSLAFAIQFPEEWLLGVFYVGIFACDVAYAVLLARQARADGVPAWARA